MTDGGLTFWTLPDAASAAFPELRAEIKATVAQYIEYLGKPPYPHVVLEEVLLPFVRRADADGDEEALRRAFAFLESVATNPDEDLVGALGHAFLDYIDPALLERRSDMAGPELLRFAREWHVADEAE